MEAGLVGSMQSRVGRFISAQVDSRNATLLAAVLDTRRHECDFIPYYMLACHVAGPCLIAFGEF